MARPWSRPLERLNQWEADLVERHLAVSQAPPTALLTRLSALARGGRLWFAIAALMAARPGVARHAARDATLAALLAIAGSHLLNRLVARPRPPARHLPARQALFDQPQSPSFPSSHSAVATAFTIAVGRRCPVGAAALVPLASIIAYARIRTRAHWPTDVLAGILLGAGVGEIVHRHPPDRDRSSSWTGPSIPL
jgi:undecaprenyl-diphosphatase